MITAAIVSPVYAQKEKEAKAQPTRGNILLVVTNHGQLGDTGKSTGYWMSEVSHAWAKFVDAGYAVTFASPAGDSAPLDPRSFKLDDPVNNRMWKVRDVVEEIADTKPLDKIDPSNYKALYFAGGHGAMWDFPDSKPLKKVTAQIYENGGIVAAVCHGPAALVNVKTTDGKYLVAGKKVAGFTNDEESSSGLTSVVPFLLQTKLEERGASVKTAPNYQEKVVTDGNLITGQNPASATGVAEAVIDKLK